MKITIHTNKKIAIICIAILFCAIVLTSLEYHNKIDDSKINTIEVIFENSLPDPKIPVTHSDTLTSVTSIPPPLKPEPPQPDISYNPPQNYDSYDFTYDLISTYSDKLTISHPEVITMEGGIINAELHINPSKRGLINYNKYFIYTNRELEKKLLLSFEQITPYVEVKNISTFPEIITINTSDMLIIWSAYISLSRNDIDSVKIKVNIPHNTAITKTTSHIIEEFSSCFLFSISVSNIYSYLMKMFDNFNIILPLLGFIGLSSIFKCISLIKRSMSKLSNTRSNQKSSGN